MTALPLGEASPLGVTILTGAVAIVVVLVALNIKPGRRRVDQGGAPTLGDDLRETVAELSDLTERLDTLIRAADERIESLKGLTAKAAHEPGADPLTRKVHELADTGRSAAQIARELNEHTGKVELILALRGSGPGLRPASGGDT